MSIIGTLPNNIQNGQLEDATPLMADFNFIVNQVNANACPATSVSSVLKGNGSGGTIAAVSGTDYVIPSGTVANATNATNATILQTTNWSVFESGGILYFLKNGVHKMNLDSSGNLVVSGNITANGNP